MPPRLSARRRARHKARRLPRHLVVPIPRPAPAEAGPRRRAMARRVARSTAARSLALALLALVAAGPATDLGHHSLAAAATGQGVRVAAVNEARIIRPLQPWLAHRYRLAHAGADASTPRWVRPGVGAMTSGFGYRWGKLHEGIDLGGPYGSAVYAAAMGVVTYAGAQDGYGELITISHGAAHGQSVVTAYGHMSSLLVDTGEHVRAGQLIAHEGAAGDATGPHLHFEVRLGGAPVDPLPWLRSHGVDI